jgi:hypothetical protein
MNEDDPSVIIGLEKLHTTFGIRAPEIVHLRPDGYIGLRTQSLREQSLLEYLGLIYAPNYTLKRKADVSERSLTLSDVN